MESGGILWQNNNNKMKHFRKCLLLDPAAPLVLLWRRLAERHFIGCAIPSLALGKSHTTLGKLRCRCGILWMHSPNYGKRKRLIKLHDVHHRSRNGLSWWGKSGHRKARNDHRNNVHPLKVIQAHRRWGKLTHSPNYIIPFVLVVSFHLRWYFSCNKASPQIGEHMKTFWYNTANL